jgi:hypothetical protein
VHLHLFHVAEKMKTKIDVAIDIINIQNPMKSQETKAQWIAIYIYTAFSFLFKV